MKSLLLASMLLLVACPQPCYRTFYGSLSYYKIIPDKTTPLGMKVDTGGHPVDLAALDSRITKIETCVNKIKSQHPTLTNEQITSWQCIDKGFIPAPIKRTCIKIKVVAPVSTSCVGNWQLLDIPAPEAVCEAKGLGPMGPECPCRWRSAVVHDWDLVTPPAMYLWDIVRIVTRCNNAWASPFAECMGEGYGWVR